MHERRTSATCDHGAPWAVPALVLVALGTVAMADAYAYIDPGTGSLLYQTLLATILGSGIIFRRAFLRVAHVTTSVIRKVRRGRRGKAPAKSDS